MSEHGRFSEAAWRIQCSPPVASPRVWHALRAETVTTGCTCFRQKSRREFANSVREKGGARKTVRPVSNTDVAGAKRALQEGSRRLHDGCQTMADGGRGEVQS